MKVKELITLLWQMDGDRQVVALVGKEGAGAFPIASFDGVIDPRETDGACVLCVSVEGELETDDGQITDDADHTDGRSSCRIDYTGDLRVE